MVPIESARFCNIEKNARLQNDEAKGWTGGRKVIPFRYPRLRFPLGAGLRLEVGLDLELDWFLGFEADLGFKADRGVELDRREELGLAPEPVPGGIRFRSRNWRRTTTPSRPNSRRKEFTRNWL